MQTEIALARAEERSALGVNKISIVHSDGLKLGDAAELRRLAVSKAPRRGDSNPFEQMSLLRLQPYR